MGARALVVYHLRKFANAINAALCFVERPDNQQSLPSEDENNVGLASQTSDLSVVGNTETTTNAEDTQTAISYDKLSQFWRDMAMGVPIWEQSTEVDAATALYGPGRQQEDFIES